MLFYDLFNQLWGRGGHTSAALGRRPSYITHFIQETPEPELEPVTGTGVNRNRLNRIRDS